MREPAIGSSDPKQAKGDEASKEGQTDTHSRRTRRHSITLTLDENGTQFPSSRDLDLQKSYVFVIRPLSPEQKAKYPNLQVCLTRLETIMNADYTQRFQYMNRSPKLLGFEIVCKS
jgi:hypothetical protein